MNLPKLRNAAALVAFGLIVGSMALAAERSADKILAEIAAVEIPSVDSTKLPPEIARRQKLVDQKAKLILELYKSSPTNPDLVRLMPERWQSRPSTTASYLTTRTELDEILAKNKNPKLVAEASYYKATLAIRKSGSNLKLDDVMPSVEDFARRFPKDERIAQLLYQVASASTDKTRQADLFARVQKDYPESPAAKKLEAKAKITSIPDNISEMVGKPFALSFTDAIKGTEVSIEGLKGKVVVVDFWATWCGPCVAEMPNMKKLYAEYKDKGVEFIGVSLDQSKEKGGLEALKSYVAKNQVGWPQYYQGNFWQGEFSSAWHVNSIPCVFLVDADGNLASVEARGQLEKLIPQYLEKAKGKASSDKTASNP